MIYYLNRGDYHTIPEENYPLREVDPRFSSRSKKPKEYKKYFCLDCGAEIQKGSTRCINCSHKIQYRCEHPSR